MSTTIQKKQKNKQNNKTSKQDKDETLPKLFKNSLPGVPLIESPFFNSVFKTEQQNDPEFYKTALELNTKGFAIIQFPDESFEQKAENIKQELYEYYDWKTYKKNPKISLRVQDAWKFNEDVKSLATNETILNYLERLYGRKPVPFQTLNFPVGTQQHFHTDAVHFSCVPERFMCGVWIALEDVEVDAGPLEYYPGSHKWPIYTNEHMGISVSAKNKINQTFYHDTWTQLVEETKTERQTFLAKKGDALIWCANLLHGGAPQLNLSKTRWSQVTHYYFENCAYYTPMHSEPFKGLIDYRNITNICTGECVPNMCNKVEIDTIFMEQSRTGFDYGKIIPINEFDLERYLRDNPDVASSGADGYEHYRKHGIVEGRKAFPMSARREPLPENIFDKRAYLAANKDVADSGVDAYEHYIKHGIDEDRPLKP
jgi:hypothetical protein